MSFSRHLGLGYGFILWRTATATGKTFENEARVRRHDGTYRWFLFRADPLRDERRNIHPFHTSQRGI
jgi:PAS domain-containing protein